MRYGNVVYSETRISVECILISIYFVLMPFSLVESSGGGSILKLVSIPIALWCLGALFVGNVRVNLNSVHLFYALYILYTVLSMLWYYNDEAWILIKGMLQIAVISFIFSFRVYNEREHELFNLSFILCGVIVMLASFFSSGVMEEGRKTMYFMGNYCDPNELCGYVFLPALIALRYVIEKRRFYLAYAGLVVGMFAVIINTGSRGGLVATLGAFVVFIMITVKGKKKKAIAITTLIIGVIVVFFIVIPLLPGGMSERYSIQRVIEDRGTGRFDIWEVVISSVCSSQWSILFGKGISSTAFALNSSGITNTVAHNNFLQMWHDQGIVGSLFFFGILISGYFRNIKKRGELSSSLAGILALALSITFDPSVKIFWNILMFSAFSYGQEGGETDGKRK